MIKGIIFDLHGTLAYKSKSVDSKKLCKLLRKNGYDIYYPEWDAAYKFVFFVEYPRSRMNSYGDFSKKVFEVLKFKPTKEILAKVSGYSKKNDQFKAYPDFKFVRNLKVKKAILTTIPLFRFDYLDIKSFDPIITGKEIGRAKPHPRGFLKILAEWKLKPDEVMMVRRY